MVVVGGGGGGGGYTGITMSMCLPVQALSRRYFLNCLSFCNKVDMKGGGGRGGGVYWNHHVRVSTCPGFVQKILSELLNLL